MNPYEILGIDSKSSLKEIKKAYLKKSKETHPDKGGTKEDFQKVKDAYDLLNDPVRKRKFDETGNIEDARAKVNHYHEIQRLFLYKLEDELAISFDLIEDMLFDINDTINDANLAIIKKDKEIQKITKFRNKIVKKKDDGFNIFEDIITGKINMLNDEKIIHIEAIKRMGEIRKIINEYTCVKESDTKVSLDWKIID